MKITGAALMTAENSFRTLCRKGVFGPFADLNTARHELTALPGAPACDLGDFGRGGMTVRRISPGGSRESRISKMRAFWAGTAAAAPPKT